jgi:hypothetical protein
MAGEKRKLKKISPSLKSFVSIGRPKKTVSVNTMTIQMHQHPDIQMLLTY